MTDKQCATRLSTAEIPIIVFILLRMSTSLSKINESISKRLSSKILFVVSALAALSAVICAIDIYFSFQLGILSNPISYDGVRYVTEARFQLLAPAPSLLHDKLTSIFAYHAPVWKQLLILSYYLFGLGDWQPYTTRFWPIFALLLLTFFVSKKAGNKLTASVFVLLTCLLPTISVGLRSVNYEYFIAHQVDFGREWFLGDLRPDLLFAAMLSGTILITYEWLKEENYRLASVVGLFAAVTVLIKPTTFSVLMLSLFSAYVYNWAILSDRKLINLFRKDFLFAFFIASLILSPWVLLGGLKLTINYLFLNTGTLSKLWSNTNPTTYSETTYYWREYVTHMGVEGVLFLILSLSVNLYLLFRNVSEAKKNGKFLWVGLVVWVYLTAIPNKNWLVGTMIYLPLHLFSVSTISGLMARLTTRQPGILKVFSAVALTVAFLVTVCALHALKHWPAEGRKIAQINQTATRDISADTARILDSSKGNLLSVHLWGYPTTISYYANRPLTYWNVTADSLIAERFSTGTSSETPPDSVLGEITNILKKLLDKVLPSTNLAEDTTTGDMAFYKSTLNSSLQDWIQRINDCPRCDLLIALNSDKLEQAGSFLTSPRLLWPYFDALNLWVKDIDSPYVLLRSYKLSPYPYTEFTTAKDIKFAPSLLLFMRDQRKYISDLGFDQPQDGILFAKGWLPEKRGNQEYYWSGNDAELIISPTKKSTLEMHLETSFGISGSAMQLSVTDLTGRLLYSGTVSNSGQQIIRFSIPPSEGKKQKLHFHVKNGGLPTHQDGFIRNYRVFFAGLS